MCSQYYTGAGAPPSLDSLSSVPSSPPAVLLVLHVSQGSTYGWYMLDPALHAPPLGDEAEEINQEPTDIHRGLCVRRMECTLRACVTLHGASLSPETRNTIPQPHVAAMTRHLLVGVYLSGLPSSVTARLWRMWWKEETSDFSG